MASNSRTFSPEQDYDIGTALVLIGLVYSGGIDLFIPLVRGGFKSPWPASR